MDKFLFDETSKSDRIKQNHACVSRIKASEKAGVKYMQKWEEKIIEREKALAEGRQEGKSEMILSSISFPLPGGFGTYTR